MPADAGERPARARFGSPSTGGLELGALVTARYGLAEGPQAFRDLVERRGLKVVVEPGR